MVPITGLLGIGEITDHELFVAGETERHMFLSQAYEEKRKISMYVHSHGYQRKESNPAIE